MVKHKKKSSATAATRKRLTNMRHLKRLRALYEHNAASGIALLAPFVIILLINAGFLLTIPDSSALANFYQWSVFAVPVILVWGLVFPALALGLNAASLISIVQNHRLNGPVRPHILARDIFPSLAISLMSIGLLGLLFGHDTSHCFSQVDFWHLGSSLLECIKNS